MDIYDAQLRRILIKLRYTDPVYDGTVPGASQARKEEEEEKEENEKEATTVVSCEMAIPLDRNHP